MTLRVLDLFSGIGGFSLGLERTGGFRTVAFVEIDPFCRRVLAKHWPEVPCYHDIRDLPPIGGVDVVCGGFPCQPFSSASRGKRQGAGDDRFLWPAMLTVIARERPAWVVAENVTDIDGMALDRVVSDLEACGYAVAPTLEIPACAVGRDHRRSRLWFIGHTDREGEPRLPVHAEMAGVPQPRGQSGGMGTSHGPSARLDRLRALGNAVVPAIPELLGRAILAAGS